MAVKNGSKRKLNLRLQPPIVGVLHEAFTVRSARNLIGESEERRRDVADNCARVVVVQEIANRKADHQVETVIGGRGTDQVAQSATRGGGRHGGSAAVGL